ncbi:MAG TPA: hypothetical protein PLI31_06715 [Methanoregulaceae archaeon]|nr:hypothetical protein [Methanoregulaceae archaeon]
MNRRLRNGEKEPNMVAIVENWAVVTGRITGLEDSAGLPELAAVSLEVEEVEPVGGYPNLVHVDPGSGLTVFVRRELTRRLGMRTGDRVSIRTRRGGQNRFYAHPDGIAVLD